MRFPLALLLSLCLSGAAFAQADPKTALLEQAGFDALSVGQPQRAADAFRQAIAADPKNARLYLGAGMAAWLEKRDDDARTALEHALALDPKLGEARRFLGQVYYRQGDLPAAIAAYQALVASSPDAPQPAATLERWRR